MIQSIKSKFPSETHFILAAASVFICVVLAYQLFQIYDLKKEIVALNEDLATTKETMNQNNNSIALSLNDLSQKTLGISNNLNFAQQNINAVKSEVGNISGTVGNLKKLSEVDPEILRKYSKVSFLSENYKPAHLTTIPVDYTYSDKRVEQFTSEAWPYLQNLLSAAKYNNIDIFVKSGYRSFLEQKSLKSAYTVTYGAGTSNAFSADQGYSEHQLGTTVDFITSGMGGQLDGFDKTNAFVWLKDNAHKFGFVLSYPKGNTYYVYEPWHWRFVGIALATYLHDYNLNFYDMDQRDIDKYLVNVY